ncbi:MAG: amidohydrolase family protein, partial [Paracoccaceae bacterium]|nr:amidohydrolase family protein [Paracoccaceae bacterium]
AQHGVSETEARQMIATSIAERSRPQEVLLSNMRAVSQMCRDHGVPLASHDDDTVAKANLMADLGAVMAEFPVTLEAAAACADRGMMIAMGAPNAMRGQSYSGNLSARDAHAAGLLHILAADYHPATILPAIRALANADPDGLAGAARLATAHPAQALGLQDRGTLEVGKRADVVMVEGNRVVASLRGGQVIFSNGVVPVEAARSAAAAPVKEVSRTG